MGKNHEVLRAADSIHAARVALLNRPININTANEIELERLPGIGPVLAARIIEERETGGPFISADDLERVPGIGEKKIAAMRDRVITSE
ncbi:ComEA family DNA-binding protein [bacterium]|nr:ComEA family DNA-binding protein [bacterium]